MKSSVLPLAIFTSTALAAILSPLQSALAAAGAIDRTAVVASVQGHHAGVESAYLLADGRLQVKLDAGGTLTTRLSSEARGPLLERATAISAAEVHEQSSLIVCRMIPPQSLGELRVSGYDASTQEFDSKRRLILTNQDCTVSHKAIPTDNNLYARALELRAALEILALDALKTPPATQDEPTPDGPVRAH